MKFCENCGTQLEDNAVFCEECGAKREAVQQDHPEVTIPEVEANAQPPKLSATCTPAKKQIAGWLLVVLLFVCSPLILFELIWWLPDLLFTIIFFGVQLVVLVTMWRKRTWKTWIKLMWTLAYIIMLFI